MPHKSNKREITRTPSLLEELKFKHDYKFLDLLVLDPNSDISERLKKFGRSKESNEEFLYLIRPYLKHPDIHIAERMRMAFYPDTIKEPGWEPKIKPTRIPVSKRITVLYRNSDDNCTTSEETPEEEEKIKERPVPPQSQWHFPPIVTKQDIDMLENKKLEVIFNIQTQDVRTQIKLEQLKEKYGLKSDQLPAITTPDHRTGPQQHEEGDGS